MSTELITRPTVVGIVKQRDLAMARYGEAHDALLAAQGIIELARRTAQDASPGVNSYNFQSDKERQYFLKSIDIGKRDDYMDAARRLTDTDVWANIIATTELERLMDKKAKDEFRQQLLTDPPEVTVDNVFATLQHVIGDADNIFKRGIAECFSNLDRRFKSHDGWKIGSRVILSRAFDEHGFWNYYANHRDTMTDIERTFFVIDGKEQPPNYAGLVGAIEEARRGKGYSARQDEVESDFFKIRIFKNGNAHVWFKRDDLLRKVNKLLGEYYGNGIPEDREAEGDVLNEPKRTLAKNFGFFPTPDAAADRAMENAIPHGAEKDGCLVLEPSAGTGNLAMRAVKMGATVDCVEMQPSLAMGLKRQGIYRRVIPGDFLTLMPDPRNLYDRVVMNPPFDRERDIDHVVHAMKFLKPGGKLTAIMSAGTEFRGTKKSEAFRAMVEKLKGDFRDLPAGSFSSVGTNVNTIVLSVWNDGRPTRY